MRLINFLLLIFILGSCTQEDSLAIMGPAYDDYLHKSEAEIVFANKVDEKRMQMVFARGNTHPELYRPVKMPTYNPAMKAMRLGGGCVNARIDRTGSDYYKKYAVKIGVTHLILCPTNSGFVGAAFKGVPSIEALPLTQELAEETNEYI